MKNTNMFMARGAQVWLFGFFLQLQSGCSITAKHTATNIVAASDSVADTLAITWNAAVQARIEHCRKLNVPASEREECLGQFRPDETDKVIVAVQALVLVQTAIKDAAECEDLGVCQNPPDWEALATQARNAWNALKPYVQALQENKQ